MALDLEAIELIKQLKHRYFRCLDMADHEGLATTLTEDVTIDYQGGSYRAQYDNRADFFEFLATAFHSEAVAQHTAHHPEIDVAADGQTATGKWYLHDIFWDLKYKVKTSGVALYEDRYVKTDDGWKIAHSGYTRVYEMVEKIEQDPPFTARHLKTAGRVLG